MSKAALPERYLTKYILSSAEGPKPPLADQIQRNFNIIEINFNKYLPEYYNEILETIFQINNLNEYDQKYKILFELMFDTYKHCPSLKIDLAKDRFLKAIRNLTALYLGENEAVEWLYVKGEKENEYPMLNQTANEMTINAVVDEIKHEAKPLIYKFRYNSPSRYLAQYYGEIESPHDRIRYSLANRITICLMNIFDGFTEQNPRMGKEILKQLSNLNSKEEYERNFKATFQAKINELYDDKEISSQFIKMKEHCLNELINLLTGQEEAYSRYDDAIDRTWLRNTCREMITNAIADFIKNDISVNFGSLVSKDTKVVEPANSIETNADNVKPRSDSFVAMVKKDADKGVSTPLL